MNIIAHLQQTPIDTLTFEQALKALQDLVTVMENGTLPLDQTIEAYTLGTKLRARCDALLAEAKMKVDQIIVPTA